ncbi:C4-dicarboxylate ABC transporter substrate-binding protein [Paracoccus aestuarii]|uniref:C4-dicarboxylate ABC transporter substrate-binding protein n=2 Tax=Paracoccus aestuarii TaxID=453842 RepID=A0A418ZZ62_9RHOB|nr:C4-dicarboxylate ABC transporter substrate-binding protein [Paracoccus aestuarii]WCR01026.1 TRAP transporter substrate-binding protein [Paracoccus aestuarii]
MTMTDHRTALGALLGGVLLAMPVAAQDITLTLHHFLGAQAPAHSQMLEPWAERIAEASDGRVRIEIYPSMTLGGRPPELVNQVRDGVVDMIWTLNGYTPGLFPRSEVFELPNVFGNDPAAANLAMRAMMDELAPDFAGTEVLFLHSHAGNAIQTGSIEARSPADLAGRDLRTPSRTGAWAIEALGGNAIAMPVPELPQALQRGTVAGALIPWEIIAPLQLQEQTDFQIEGHDRYRFGTSVFQVSMNQARWDSLPEDIRQIFRDHSDEAWLAEVGAIWRAADDRGIGLAVDAGNTHVTLTEDETAAFRDALEPVVQRWIDDVTPQGVDGAGLVARARDAIAAQAGSE